MLWHRDRLFDLTVDTRRRTLHMPVVLPEVPPDSDMDRDFVAFVESQQSDEVPEHRRIDAGRVRIECANKAGDVSLTFAATTGDYDYATRKMIALVHEVFMVFLYDGRYYDYLVETFNLDPDKM